MGVGSRSLSRHVFRGQRERPAAPGGAAEAGGWRGEDQGLPGSCRASAVLHTECMQGRPAARCSGWKQPLPGAQVLCSTLKTGKKLAEEALCAHGDGWLQPSPKKTAFKSQVILSVLENGLVLGQNPTEVNVFLLTSLPNLLDAPLSPWSLCSPVWDRGMFYLLGFAFQDRKVAFPKTEYL